jgi:indole-3-glycerol phosphate synthase
LFRRSLSDEKSIKIIAEFKRASPSKGDINGEADPVAIARAYEAGGAAAISVLTEEDKFLGSPADLSAVRAATHLPVLRKDFIFAVEQVYETALMGADALLLIVAALDDATLISLRALTEDELGLDALVEVHTAEEMRRARNCRARIIGVNNRDLHTFRVSLDTSVALAALAPPGVTLISESGLQTSADLRRLREVGYGGFLIGENLMRAADPAAALRSLLGREAS